MIGLVIGLFVVGIPAESAGQSEDLATDQATDLAPPTVSAPFELRCGGTVTGHAQFDGALQVTRYYDATGRPEQTFSELDTDGDGAWNHRWAFATSASGDVQREYWGIFSRVPDGLWTLDYRCYDDFVQPTGITESVCEDPRLGSAGSDGRLIARHRQRGAAHEQTQLRNDRDLDGYDEHIWTLTHDPIDGRVVHVEYHGVDSMTPDWQWVLDSRCGDFVADILGL